MTENKKIIAPPLGQTLQGFYKVAVVGDDNKVVWEQEKWGKNLIVNSGMDSIAAIPYASVFYYGDAGTGVRPNYVSSLGTMATADGAGNVYLFIPTGSTFGDLQYFTQSIEGYTQTTQPGDVIQFTDGTNALILTVSSGSLTVNSPITINPSQSFTIWKTSQSDLQDHQKYAGATGVTDSTVVNGWPQTGTSSSLNNVVHARTFDFPKEVSLTQYTEVGTRYNLGAGSLFSRIVLPNSVSVDVNQRLRLSYQLQVTWQPTQSIYRPNISVTGWPVYPSTNTNGSESIQNFDTNINPASPNPFFVSYVLSSGISSGGNGVIEPVSTPSMFISTNTQSLQPFGLSFDRTVNSSATVNLTNATTLLPYTSLNFYNDRMATFAVGEANYSNIACMGFGYIQSVNGKYPYQGSNTGNPYQAFTFIFEQPQVKNGTQTLTISWRCTWNTGTGLKEAIV